MLTYTGPPGSTGIRRGVRLVSQVFTLNEKDSEIPQPASLRRVRKNSVPSKPPKEKVRLELIQIVEKVWQLVHARNFPWALEHIKAGLAMNSTYVPLLIQYALCETRLGNQLSAIKKYTEILKIDPNNRSVIFNYAKLLILSNDIDGFDKFYAKKRISLTLSTMESLRTSLIH
jgi:tetratricopeptide (TPR) repeat protein